jgi:hypothetical protein
MRRLWVLLALLVIALATSAIRREASWTPARIGEHWILEGDVHVHTSFAGALSTPIDIPLLASRRQLDFVCVTEHNAWFGGAVTRSAGHVLAPDVIVLPSEEITNRAYHLLAIGLSSRVDPTLPLSRIADEAHRQGGIVLAAHPTRGTWPLMLGLAEAKKLDGAEVFHPTMLANEEVAQEYAAFFAEASQRSGTPLISAGSSDYHGGKRLGTSRTIVLARERTAASILEALRAGRAVAATSDGRWSGDPRWIATLTEAAYVSRAHSAPEAAPTWWAERALAWLAFAVMVGAVFRRR